MPPVEDRGKTYFCTYRVTESDPGSRPARTVSYGLRLVVGSEVTQPLALPPLNKVDLAVGTFHDEELPAATGGVQPYTHAFTCAGGSLPSGMGFAPATRRFAGTPDARFRDSCTYSVTDSAQPAATVPVAVEVEVTGAATQPLALPRLSKVDLAVGTFHDEELPAATGGVQPYTHAFTCAGGSLPSGMGFAPATRRFAGTPDARFRDSCTYSVTDSAQPAATVPVAVEVEVTGAATQPLALPPLSKVDLAVGTFHDEELPAATGGVQPYTHAFTCAGGSLPSGMGFAPATRRFAGTPDARFRDSCTYSVTDSAQPAATVPVAVEVEVTGAATQPLALPPLSKVDLAVGTFHDEALPAATGGVQPYTHAFTCAGGSLPSGMGFAPATRRFAGTPDARFRDSCTYSVTDSAQPAATVSVAVEVEVTGAATQPLALPPLSKVDLAVGTFHDEALPAATGGVQPYTHAFTCAGGSLPSGMGFAPATRRFAGTPDARFRDSCTYSVTDSAQPAATVSVAVEVEVTGAATQPLALPRLSKVDLAVGTFHDKALPAATGGVQPYTHAFTCAGGSLPSGMGFAPATRRFAGTPDARFRDSCTYSVTDSAQPAATVSRAVEVEVTGGATPLELTQVFETVSGNELTLNIGRRSQTTFQMASDGVAPYTYELLDCTLPAGLEFHPSTRILSGRPNAEYRGPNCTYRVTDSSSPPASVSLSFVLVVEPLEVRDWRFRTRTVEPRQGLCVVPGAMPMGTGPVDVAILPAAHAGEGVTSVASYALHEVPVSSAESDSVLSFNPDDRVLAYSNPAPPPVLGTPNTYRYLVGTDDDEASVDETYADDALCLDVQYNADDGICSDRTPNPYIRIVLQVRDDAFWDENAGGYRCPDTTAPEPRPGAQGSPSNPVHEALGPVHARRASAVAHAAVLDRVLGWSPGAEQASFAIAPEVGIASLSGRSGGFDYSGTSESASFGAETGAGAWQAGLVASITNTELHYRAEAVLTAQGYRTGEHDTEILSLHPFAAWHAPSGGHVWASLGAGAGSLSHRDDLGFPSWSRSDVRLSAYAAGASVPVADVLSGALQADAGIESFALDIEGGGRISSSLPTVRGRDYRAGLAWSGSVTGAPSLSVAYKRLTGDGPEGGQLEARGSVSVAGIFDPRLTVIGNAEGSFGLGDYEHDSWGLGGGVRFAPGDGDRGFGLDLDTRLVSLDDGGSSDVGIRGEAGYGLWGGPFFGTVRPHVGLIRHSSNGSLRRALGVDLRDTPDSRIKVEVYDELRDRFRALRFTLRHRF